MVVALVVWLGLVVVALVVGRLVVALGVDQVARLVVLVVVLALQLGLGVRVVGALVVVVVVGQLPVGAVVVRGGRLGLRVA